MMVLYEIFATYIITLIVTSSSLAAPLRNKLIRATPSLRVRNYPHLFECRLCFGFWAGLFVVLCYNDFSNFPLVYGASYFLATQERS